MVKKLGLLPSVIKAAKTDPILVNMKDSTSFYLPKYRAACTSNNCLVFLENFINSDLSGRAAYRSYILNCLAAKVPDEQVDDEATQKLILTEHKKAIENEREREWAMHLKKFADPSSSEAVAAWEKTLKTIQLKENPYLDSNLYANYQYRLNSEDSEYNQLTKEAIRLFAQDALLLT
jgi:hypothetical protein